MIEVKRFKNNPLCNKFHYRIIIIFIITLPCLDNDLMFSD